MSILTRLTGQHLDDAALAEIWTNAVAEGGHPADPHFDACAECRLRFASFAAWVDEIRTDAIEEADGVITPERLAAQQAHIMRRLEAAERPTRVIAFPTASISESETRSSPVRRWIVTAAAAGLVAGIGLGQLMTIPRLSGPSVFPADRPVSIGRGPSANPSIIPAVAVTNDDRLVAEFELEAAATPQYETLRAFDTFTPRAGDFLTTSR